MLGSEQRPSGAMGRSRCGRETRRASRISRDVGGEVVAKDDLRGLIAAGILVLLGWWRLGPAGS